MRYVGNHFTAFDQMPQGSRRSILAVVENKTGRTWNLAGERAVYIASLLFNLGDLVDVKFVDHICATAMDFEPSSPRSKDAA